MKRPALAAIAAVAFTFGGPNVNPSAHAADAVLIAQADEAPREPTPTWVTVDAGPETGTAAEAPGPVAPSSPPATATPTIDPIEDPVGYARELYDAWRDGDGDGHRARAIFALLIIGLVAWMRSDKWGIAKVIPWFGGERGGPALAGATALLLGLGNAIAAGATIDVDTVIALLEVGILAMGGWSGAKHVFFPKKTG